MPKPEAYDSTQKTQKTGELSSIGTPPKSLPQGVLRKENEAEKEKRKKEGRKAKKARKDTSNTSQANETNQTLTCVRSKAPPP